MRFEAFENGLTVMERSQRGRKRERAEGNDLGRLPPAGFPIGNEHVVAESGAELGVFPQCFCKPRLGYASDRNRCGHRASHKEKRGAGQGPPLQKTNKIENQEKATTWRPWL